MLGLKRAPLVRFQPEFFVVTTIEKEALRPLNSKLRRKGSRGTIMVAGPGIEPGTVAYETTVLPLHYPAIVLYLNNCFMAIL